MNTALAFDKTIPSHFTLDSYKKHFADFLEWLKVSSQTQTVNSLVKARAMVLQSR